MDRVVSTFDFSAPRVFKDKAATPALIKANINQLLDKAITTINESLNEANMAWNLEIKAAKEKGTVDAIITPRIAIPMLEQDISIYSPLGLRVAEAILKADELLLVHSKLAWNGFRSTGEIRGVQKRVMADLRSFLIHTYQINLSFLTGRPMQVEAMMREDHLAVDSDDGAGQAPSSPLAA